MKHFNLIYYKNIYTVKLIETDSYKKIRNFSSSGPIGRLLSNAGGQVGLSETGIFGGEISLSSSSSSRKVISADAPISKSSSAVGEKRVSNPGLKTAYPSNGSISQ